MSLLAAEQNMSFAAVRTSYLSVFNPNHEHHIRRLGLIRRVSGDSCFALSVNGVHVFRSGYRSTAA